MTERLTRDALMAQADRIMREVAWHSQKQITQMLTRAGLDLTLPQMITLFAIHERGSCRMSCLADITQQSAGTLTGIIDRLIDDGLVARVRNETDRRVVEVVLTPQGQERLDRVMVVRREEMGRLFGRFNDHDLTHLVSMLDVLLDGLRSPEHNEPELELEC
jgi:DNA-binding MarR family transcriptional regulator